MQNMLWIIAGVFVAGCVILFVFSLTAPRPDSIGLVDGKLAPVLESPNSVSTQAADPLHAIEPFVYQGSADDAMAVIRRIVSDMPGGSIIKDESGYLYAEFRSRLFRFVDDVEFLVEPETRQIQFRSASRVGHSDMGVNRQRMEEIRRRFQDTY